MYYTERILKTTSARHYELHCIKTMIMPQKKSAEMTDLIMYFF